MKKYREVYIYNTIIEIAVMELISTIIVIDNNTTIIINEDKSLIDKSLYNEVEIVKSTQIQESLQTSYREMYVPFVYVQCSY